MRARYPDIENWVVRDGVRIGYEVYGTAGPTILLPTSMPLVHARQWKAQVPYLARHFRVIVVDHRGNGRSDRPRGAAAYAPAQDVADLVAVLDATGTRDVVAVGFSGGARRASELAAAHPERVAGLMAVAPAVMLEYPGVDEVRESYEGPEKMNRHYIAQDFAGFVDFFFSGVNSDPHSTKPFEDAVGWARGTTAEVLVDAFDAPAARPPSSFGVSVPPSGAGCWSSTDRPT